jgi:CRP-like cAMP-binding protein
MMLETRHSIREILSHLPVFHCLEAAELDLLASRTWEYRVGKHELLFQKGEPVNGIHIVVTGLIKLFLPSADGADKMVHLAGPGDSFGEEGVFMNRPYPVSAQAGKESVLLVMERQPLLDAVAANTMLAVSMMARLSSRIYDLTDNMQNCVQRNCVQRVIHFLTHQAPREEDCYDLQLETNKQTIASQLNLAPETFSRILGRLAREGYIRVNGRSITVMKIDALRNYVG